MGQHNLNHPEIFNNINWSTDIVFSQTREKLKNQNLNYHILEYFNDIDEISDINGKVIKIINKYEPELRIFD